MPQQQPQWWVQRPGGPVLMTKSAYYALFGSTRDERAKNMQLAGQRLVRVPGRQSVWKAPSQALQMPDKYTVRKYQNRSCACTCPDFLRHALYDDTFACKHMLMPEV